MRSSLALLLLDVTHRAFVRVFRGTLSFFNDFRKFFLGTLVIDYRFASLQFAYSLPLLVSKWFTSALCLHLRLLLYVFFATLSVIVTGIYAFRNFCESIIYAFSFSQLI